MSLSIILADDQPKVRFALRVLIENRQDTEIIGEAEDASELIDLLEKLSPTVIIMDWLLPGLPNVGSVKKIRELCPDAAILALSVRPELEREALVNGVDAFISKIDPPEHIQGALDQIHSRSFKPKEHVTNRS